MRYNGKYAKPSVRPPLRLGSLMMRIAAVLLCLVMVSIHLMSGMYAKYTTNGSGNDDARVAKFDVNITGDAEAVVVDCAKSTDNVYSITIANTSEVAVSYTLAVTWNNTAVMGTFDETSGTLAALNDTDMRTLTFTVNDWSEITKTMTGENGEVSLNFTVTINVVQVD